MKQNIKLRDGQLMSPLAIGTAFINDPGVIEQAIAAALKVGYRHIDVDQAFAGIAGVHAALAAAGLNRDQIFITAKLSVDAIDQYGIEEATSKFLNSLEMSDVDALLLRNLGSAAKNNEAWQKMIQILKAGQARAIGVVDFNQDDLQRLIEATDEIPMIDQYVVRIGDTPLSLLDFCKEHQIAMEAYSPVMHGLLLRAPIVTQLAQKYQVSVNQLCIRYVVQQGLAVWRQTIKVDHMIENQQIDFSIEKDDLKTLQEISL